jgi:sodium-dependent dicarboxylate transporter 2/3/5
MKSIISWISGPALGALLGYLQYQSSDSTLQAWMTVISIWMAVWWVTECVSLYITALLPLICFPMLGIMDMQETAPLYNQEIIFLFIGGFILAFGLEKHQVHTQIAAGILKFTGSKPAGILLGFMLSGWFISMWISNIATAMMLLPAGMALIRNMEQNPAFKSFAPALLLGIAYSASIGGTATLVGTAPNMIFMAFFNTHYPELPPITFTSWMIYALPLSAVMFLAAFGILYLIFIPKSMPNFDIQSYFQNQNLSLRGMESGAKRTLSLFVLTILLWCFRADIVLGDFLIPGWTRLFPNPDFVKDSTIAMLMAIIMLLWTDNTGKKLLEWKDVQRMPLGILFLFGGGFALAKGIQTTGLSLWMSEQLTVLKPYPIILVVIILSVFMTFLTELTSNTASTYLVLPVLLSMCMSMEVHPFIFMFPVVITASYAFMLPVATPPNTVIFATEKINIRTMAFTGLWLNIAGVILISLFAWLFLI